MSCVWIKSWKISLQPNVRHNFMLSFARDTGIRKDHLQSLNNQAQEGNSWLLTLKSKGPIFTLILCQPGSQFILNFIKYRRADDSNSINSVPGVITFESKPSVPEAVPSFVQLSLSLSVFEA